MKKALLLFILLVNLAFGYQLIDVKIYYEGDRIIEVPANSYETTLIKLTFDISRDGVAMLHYWYKGHQGRDREYHSNSVYGKLNSISVIWDSDAGIDEGVNVVRLVCTNDRNYEIPVKNPLLLMSMTGDDDFLRWFYLEGFTGAYIDDRQVACSYVDGWVKITDLPLIGNSTTYTLKTEGGLTIELMREWQNDR